jgi:hypothetical protein
MPAGTQAFTGKRLPFVSIVGGKIAQKVDKDYPGAEKRIIENKDGTRTEKWEFYYKSWVGKIEGLFFKELPFGEQLFIKFEDVIISVPVASNQFKTFAERLPNIDLKEQIDFSPYAFVTAENKTVKGVGVYQNGSKIDSYYKSGKVPLNGYPEVDNEAVKNKSYWKSYFAQVEAFLRNEMELFIRANFPRMAKKVEEPVKEEEPAKEVELSESDLSDLPF